MTRLLPMLLLVTLLVSCVQIDMGAKVRILRDDYDIVAFSKDVVLLPVTAEGAFPKTKDLTQFMSIAPPENVVANGVQYKKFTIGNNICAQFNKMSQGTILLSEKNRELIIDAKLSPSYWDQKNHSGHYSNITIQYPEIIEISDDTDIPSLVGKYVFLVGKFVDNGGQFLSHNHMFLTNGFSSHDESNSYEVVATLDRPGSKNFTSPTIYIITHKKVGAASRTNGCQVSTDCQK